MDQRIERISVHRPEELAGAVRLLRSPAAVPKELSRQVEEIIEAVRSGGDAALIEYTRRFDWSEASADRLLVDTQELDEAIASLEPAVYAALETAIANVAQVTAATVGEEGAVRLAQGQRVAVRATPVQSAAIYVPGGRHPYASTVVMGTVTARAAGVLEVVIATPPGPDGRIDPCVLAACRMCGATRIYRMGGAQAVAALAWGTETVTPVQLIAGPGNVYVQEAKRQLHGVVGTDGFAGPSDLLVLFSSPAFAPLVALDLLAQAEHGSGTVVVGASPDRQALDRLEAELAAQLADQQPPEGARLYLVELADVALGIDLANRFAPEHLELVGEPFEGKASQVWAAGCLLVGPYSATAFGDYIAGSNHILPTGGAAAFSSSLSAATFLKRSYEVRIDPAAAARLAELAAPLAVREGFPLHARSMTVRAEGGWEG